MSVRKHSITVTCRLRDGNYFAALTKPKVHRGIYRNCAGAGPTEEDALQVLSDMIQRVKPKTIRRPLKVVERIGYTEGMQQAVTPVTPFPPVDEPNTTLVRIAGVVAESTLNTINKRVQDILKTNSVPSILPILETLLKFKATLENNHDD